MTRERGCARRRALVTAGFLSWALGLAGCNDNDLGIDSRRPNRPPETVLSSGPPDSTNATSYRVQLFWSGSDPDGTIDHFDYILVDHPASDSTITGEPNDPNLVIVRPPERDDPRWTSTNSNDTLIVTRADTLRRDPRPDPNDDEDSNEVVRTTTFERWHTFFIRSVDNEGIEDDSPEYRSFNSRTIAPTVELLPPINEGIVFSGPRTIVFNWNGSDPIGDGNSIEPVAARWVLIPSVQTTSGWRGYPDSLYYLPRGFAWSEWFAWDRSDGKGRQAVIRNLLPAESSPNNPNPPGYYLFAVQAMDEAGAVTPVFDSDAPGKNNVAKVTVSNYVGSTLNVTERVLGTYNFVGGSRPVVLDMAAGQTIEFRWRGDATSYGGTITGYRYGWNIRNPQTDEEWDQNWSAQALSSVPRTFNAGTHRFFLECRDNAETVTHAEIELVVRQVTRSKDLLFVDDTEQPNAASEPEEDARWIQLFDALVDRRPSIDFQSSRDIYDVVENRYFPPPIARVFDYKTIVWAVVQGRSGSALKTLGLFFDPFLVRNQSQVPPFNYLNIYLDNGGELWLSGDQVGAHHLAGAGANGRQPGASGQRHQLGRPVASRSAPPGFGWGHQPALEARRRDARLGRWQPRQAAAARPHHSQLPRLPAGPARRGASVHFERAAEPYAWHHDPHGGCRGPAGERRDADHLNDGESHAHRDAGFPRSREPHRWKRNRGRDFHQRRAVVA